MKRIFRTFHLPALYARLNEASKLSLTGSFDCRSATNTSTLLLRSRAPSTTLCLSALKEATVSPAFVYLSLRGTVENPRLLFLQSGSSVVGAASNLFLDMPSSSL